MDWNLTLTMSLWYLGVINYELLVASDVAIVSTPVAVGGTGNVRLENRV